MQFNTHKLLAQTLLDKDNASSCRAHNIFGGKRKASVIEVDYPRLANANKRCKDTRTALEKAQKHASEKAGDNASEKEQETASENKGHGHTQDESHIIKDGRLSVKCGCRSF